MAHRRHVLLHGLDRPPTFPAADAFPIAKDDHVKEPNQRLEIHYQRRLEGYDEAVRLVHV